MSDTTETETDTNTNTDEPSKAELHDRVQQLESTVEKLMPSRRDALKFGAAGIAGAAGLGATSQTADASTGSAGRIGSNSDRPDLFADQVDANTTKTDTNLRVGGLDFINHIEKFQTGGATANISVPTVGVLEGVKTVVECYYDTGANTADCLLRFNGDGSSTGNYQYQTDEGASAQTNQDEIKLLNVTNQFGFASFTIEISAVEHIGVTIDTREFSDRCNPVAVRGRRAIAGQLDSIQIAPSGSARSLFGRVYQRELQ